MIILNTVQKLDKVNNIIYLPVDDEEIYEKDSGNPEIVDAEASVHIEAPVSIARYGAGTHMTPKYLLTMYIDVKNINKYDKKTRRKIYKSIGEPYF